MSKRNENRPGYKKTKVGWIPEEWIVKTFDHISNVVRGSSPRPAGSPLFFNGTYIPWITVAELTNIEGMFLTSTKSMLTEEGAKRSRIFPKGSLLLVNSGATLGVPKISCIEACGNDGIAGFLDLSSETDTSFLYYFLCTKTRYFRECLAPGLGQPNLNTELIGGVSIPLPPLPEQRKIAEILSAWDRAIEITNRLITNYELLKKGLMQQLLTGRMRFPEFGKPIQKKGELPEGWQIKRTSSLGSFLKGKGISNSEKEESGLPCVTYGEIYTKHEIVIKKFSSFIDKDTAQKSQQIQRNDILFAGSGETLDEIGKCVAFTKDIEAYAGGDIVILRTKDVNALYLSYSLNSDLLIRQKRKLGQGHSVVHIYSSGLKTLQVPLPSLEEQTRIAAVLSACDREIELLKKKQEKLKEQKKGLMQKLLTGEIRHPEFLTGEEIKVKGERKGQDARIRNS